MPEEFFFKVGENTQRFQINGRGHTIDYFASLHVSMSSSNASSCIILLVLATVNFLDMGCWSAPRLFKNLTETSELATKFFFVLGNYRSNLVLMDERFLLLKISLAGRC